MVATNGRALGSDTVVGEPGSGTAAPEVPK
jgi:hypothetical protein